MCQWTLGKSQMYVSRYLVSYIYIYIYISLSLCMISRISVSAEYHLHQSCFCINLKLQRSHSFDAVSSGNNWSSAPSPGFQNGFKYLVANGHGTVCILRWEHIFRLGFTIVLPQVEGKMILQSSKALQFCSSPLVPFQFCSCHSFLHGQSL